MSIEAFSDAVGKYRFGVVAGTSSADPIWKDSPFDQLAYFIAFISSFLSFYIGIGMFRLIIILIPSMMIGYGARYLIYRLVQKRASAEEPQVAERTLSDFHEADVRSKSKIAPIAIAGTLLVVAWVLGLSKAQQMKDGNSVLITTSIGSMEGNLAATTASGIFLNVTGKGVVFLPYEFVQVIEPYNP
jgi:hypothetical protein